MRQEARCSRARDCWSDRAVSCPALLDGAGGLIVALGIPALVVTVALLWWALHGRIRSNGAARVANSW
jgi:hypothetical protein